MLLYQDSPPPGSTVRTKPIIAAYRKGWLAATIQALAHLKVLTAASHQVALRTPTASPQSFNKGLLIVRTTLIFGDLVAGI